MDSTVFIRNKWRLAGWLVLPLLALVTIELSSRSFYSIQQAAYQRRQVLTQLIPDMVREGAYFSQFMKNFAISTEDSAALEDASIELLNKAEEASGFKITSMKLVQERNETTHTIKVVVSVDGIGSCRNIVAFLQQIKRQDPLIYEEQLALTGVDESTDQLQLNAQLGRVYMEGEGGRP